MKSAADQPDNSGFLNAPQVRLPLPGMSGRVADTACDLGKGQYVDAFEQAIRKTLDIVKHIVRHMALGDIPSILSDGNCAVNRYLLDKTGCAVQSFTSQPGLPAKPGPPRPACACPPAPATP